jgi:2-dehydro-3-deoxyphosphooctonate aldolase (KDO 8-P synthase)
VRPVSIGAFAVGGGQPVALIAGPCVIESAAHALHLATAIKDIAARCGMPLIFKASYDKANRTSRTSFRGPGLDAGLRTLADIKSKTGLAILTDIHEPSHAGSGGRGCRRAADSRVSLSSDRSPRRSRENRQDGERQERPVPAPADMRHVIQKITAEGNESVLVTERGVSFGYNNLVVDVRAFPMLRELGYPVVFDVTHSLQLPGGGDGVTAGLAQYIEPLASAGVAAGVDAIFMEVHEDPSRAKSDAGNALRLDLLEPLLNKLTRIARAAQEQPVPSGVRP